MIIYLQVTIVTLDFQDECILIEDSNACTAEFVIYSFLELYLRD